MPSDKAMRIAEIILNGQTYMFTEFGRKTQVGIADLIDNQMAEETPDLPAEKQAKCPKCGKRGGVTVRKDAFVNHPVAADGSVDWDDLSDVSTFDDNVYECMLCNESLEESDIESANEFTIE